MINFKLKPKITKVKPVKKEARFVVIEGSEDVFVPVLSPVAARLSVVGKTQLLE